MQTSLLRRPAAPLASERRIALRSDVEAPLSYSFLKNFSSRTYDATARNCSDDGLCIETLNPLSPEQYLSIRKKRGARSSSGIKNGHLLKSFTVAQVRWRQAKTGGRYRRYIVGLKYF